jgi:hypothetical protein
VHHEQAVSRGLQFDAEAHEPPFDLGIQVVELPVREKRRVFVEPADRCGGHLHQCHCWLDAEQRVSRAGHPGGHGLGIRLRGYGPSGSEASDLLAVQVATFGRGLAGVQRHEGRIVDRDVDGEPAAGGEAIEVGCIDVVRGDPRQDFGIHPPRFGFGQCLELLAEGRLGMPPGDVAVKLREVVLLAERRGERALASGDLADAHHVGPAALVDEGLGAGGEVVGMRRGVMSGSGPVEARLGDGLGATGEDGEDGERKQRREAAFYTLERRLCPAAYHVVNPFPEGRVLSRQPAVSPSTADDYGSRFKGGQKTGGRVRRFLAIFSAWLRQCRHDRHDRKGRRGRATRW